MSHQEEAPGKTQATLEGLLSQKHLEELEEVSRVKSSLLRLLPQIK